MKHFAITCCVGEASNFLYLTLPQNKQFFDSYIVITDSSDDKTRQIVEKSGATCIITDSFYTHGCKFNRGSAYNDCFNVIRDWEPEQITLLNVDCYIPNELGNIIKNYQWDKEWFYGG